MKDNFRRCYWSLKSSLRHHGLQHLFIPNHEHRLTVGSCGKKKRKKTFCTVQLIENINHIAWNTLDSNKLRWRKQFGKNNIFRLFVYFLLQRVAFFYEIPQMKNETTRWRSNYFITLHLTLCHNKRVFTIVRRTQYHYYATLLSRFNFQNNTHKRAGILRIPESTLTLPITYP